MSFTTGLPLYDVWFGNRLSGADPETTHARRTRALDGIASAMAQLGAFSFGTSGCPIFGTDGGLLGVGGQMRQVDQQAMLDRWFVHEDPSDDPIYVPCVPSSNTHLYYTHMIDAHPEHRPLPKGVVMLLRQLISWIPDPVNATDSFVLAHPDFDIQNFIVSDQGEHRGIIDWDGVAAVPRTLGNERYPGWLTRDWDPAMYRYQESMDLGVQPEGVWEGSPACLAYYRGAYEKTIRSYSQADSDFCRMSLITENLAIAARHLRCRSAILRKIVHEVWAAAGQGDGLKFPDLIIMFAQGNVDITVLNFFKSGLYFTII